MTGKPEAPPLYRILRTGHEIVLCEIRAIVSAGLAGNAQAAVNVNRNGGCPPIHIQLVAKTQGFALITQVGITAKDFDRG